MNVTPDTRYAQTSFSVFGVTHRYQTGIFLSVSSIKGGPTMECLKKRICRVLRHFLALPLLVVAVSTGSAFAEDKEVTVAYQLIVGPYLTAIANGSFEKATGYKIKWRQFNSGGEVTSAMASGDVPIGVIGSTGLAASASRGVEL